jgi:hypothetical protein
VDTARHKGSATQIYARAVLIRTLQAVKINEIQAYGIQAEVYPFFARDMIVFLVNTKVDSCLREPVSIVGTATGYGLDD